MFPKQVHSGSRSQEVPGTLHGTPPWEVGVILRCAKHCCTLVSNKLMGSALLEGGGLRSCLRPNPQRSVASHTSAPTFAQYLTALEVCAEICRSPVA